MTFMVKMLSNRRLWAVSSVAVQLRGKIFPTFRNVFHVYLMKELQDVQDMQEIEISHQLFELPATYSLGQPIRPSNYLSIIKIILYNLLRFTCDVAVSRIKSCSSLVRLRSIPWQNCLQSRSTLLSLVTPRPWNSERRIWLILQTMTVGKQTSQKKKKKIFKCCIDSYVY